MKLKDAFQLAYHNLHAAREAQKIQYDKRAKLQKFEVGDKVFMTTVVVKQHQSPKFTPKWQGPFRITRKISDLLYEVNTGKIGKEQIIHVNRLKPCFESKIWENAMRNGNSYYNPMSKLPLPLIPNIGNDQEAIETAPQLQSNRTVRFSPQDSSTPQRIQRDRQLSSPSPCLSSPLLSDSSCNESTNPSGQSSESETLIDSSTLINESESSTTFRSALETSSDGNRQSNSYNLLQSPHRPLEMSQEQNKTVQRHNLRDRTKIFKPLRFRNNCNVIDRRKLPTKNNKLE